MEITVNAVFQREKYAAATTAHRTASPPVQLRPSHSKSSSSVQFSKSLSLQLQEVENKLREQPDFGTSPPPVDESKVQEEFAHKRAVSFDSAPLPPKPARLTKEQKVQQAKNARPRRPSLSSQLASFMGQQDQLLGEIRQMNDNKARPVGEKTLSGGSNSYCSSNNEAKIHKPTPVMTVSTRLLKVGDLASKFPAPVSFFIDHCRYSFHHPFMNLVIDMEMYYRDMEFIVLDTRKKSFHFKIMHHLIHFAKDYFPLKNAQHCLCIDLNSETDAQKLKINVLKPFILQI